MLPKLDDLTEEQIMKTKFNIPGERPNPNWPYERADQLKRKGISPARGLSSTSVGSKKAGLLNIKGSVGSSILVAGSSAERP